MVGVLAVIFVSDRETSSCKQHIHKIWREIIKKKEDTRRFLCMGFLSERWDVMELVRMKVLNMRRSGILSMGWDLDDW